MLTINLNLCLKCFACIPACPNGLISEGPKGPKFDNKHCKKCEKCAEICPAGAIKV